MRRIVEGIVTQVCSSPLPLHKSSSLCTLVIPAKGICGVQDVGEALEMEPNVFQAVLSKALQAQRAADAAKKARELVRRKSVLSKSTLPGKLADCSSTDKAISEIFLVEGDSAGAPVLDWLSGVR